jgi:GNAT superfamily N-acetyltransferase
MLELRAFDGDAATLSAFCRTEWRRHLEGLDLCPQWDERFFDWQLTAPELGARDYLVAAYDGATLAGVLLAAPCDARVEGATVEATTASWLTVSQAYLGHGIGARLVDELMRRQLERGAQFCFGVITGGEGKPSAKFWRSYARQRPGRLRQLARVGTWVRGLQPQVLTDAALDRRHLWLARVLRWCGRPIAAVSRPDVRAYDPGDFARCRDLVHRVVDGSDLAMSWPDALLARQLSHRGFTRTIVLAGAGGATGLVNYYPLPFLARGELTVAVIDFVVTDGLDRAEARALLDAACASMRDDGCALAVALRLPAFRAAHMLAGGFLPLPADNVAVAVMSDPATPLQAPRRLFMPIR